MFQTYICHIEWADVYHLKLRSHSKLYLKISISGTRYDGHPSFLIKQLNLNVTRDNVIKQMMILEWNSGKESHFIITLEDYRDS